MEYLHKKFSSVAALVKNSFFFAILLLISPNIYSANIDNTEHFEWTDPETKENFSIPKPETMNYDFVKVRNPETGEMETEPILRESIEEVKKFSVKKTIGFYSKSLVNGSAKLVKDYPKEAGIFYAAQFAQTMRKVFLQTPIDPDDPAAFKILLQTMLSPMGNVGFAAFIGTNRAFNGIVSALVLSQLTQAQVMSLRTTITEYQAIVLANKGQYSGKAEALRKSVQAQLGDVTNRNYISNLRHTYGADSQKKAIKEIRKAQKQPLSTLRKGNKGEQALAKAMLTKQSIKSISYLMSPIGMSLGMTASLLVEEIHHELDSGDMGKCIDLSANPNRTQKEEYQMLTACEDAFQEWTFKSKFSELVPEFVSLTLASQMGHVMWNKVRKQIRKSFSPKNSSLKKAIEQQSNKVAKGFLAKLKIPINYLAHLPKGGWLFQFGTMYFFFEATGILNPFLIHPWKTNRYSKKLSTQVKDIEESLKLFKKGTIGSIEDHKRCGTGTGGSFWKNIFSPQCPKSKKGDILSLLKEHRSTMKHFREFLLEPATMAQNTWMQYLQRFMSMTRSTGAFYEKIIEAISHERSAHETIYSICVKELKTNPGSKEYSDCYKKFSAHPKIFDKLTTFSRDYKLFSLEPSISSPEYKVAFYDKVFGLFQNALKNINKYLLKNHGIRNTKPYRDWYSNYKKNPQDKSISIEEMNQIIDAFLETGIINRDLRLLIKIRHYFLASHLAYKYKDETNSPILNNSLLKKMILPRKSAEDFTDYKSRLAILQTGLNYLIEELTIPLGRNAGSLAISGMKGMQALIDKNKVFNYYGKSLAFKDYSDPMSSDHTNITGEELQKKNVFYSIYKQLGELKNVRAPKAFIHTLNSDPYIISPEVMYDHPQKIGDIDTPTLSDYLLTSMVCGQDVNKMELVDQRSFFDKLFTLSFNKNENLITRWNEARKNNDFKTAYEIERKIFEEKNQSLIARFVNEKTNLRGFDLNFTPPKIVNNNDFISSICDVERFKKEFGKVTTKNEALLKDKGRYDPYNTTWTLSKSNKKKQKSFTNIVDVLRDNIKEELIYPSGTKKQLIPNPNGKGSFQTIETPILGATTWWNQKIQPAITSQYKYYSNSFRESMMKTFFKTLNDKRTINVGNNPSIGSHYLTGDVSSFLNKENSNTKISAGLLTSINDEINFLFDVLNVVVPYKVETDGKKSENPETLAKYQQQVELLKNSTTPLFKAIGSQETAECKIRKDKKMVNVTRSLFFCNKLHAYDSLIPLITFFAPGDPAEKLQQGKDPAKVARVSSNDKEVTDAGIIEWLEVLAVKDQKNCPGSVCGEIPPEYQAPPKGFSEQASAAFKKASHSLQGLLKKSQKNSTKEDTNIISEKNFLQIMSKDIKEQDIERNLYYRLVASHILRRMHEILTEANYYNDMVNAIKIDKGGLFQDGMNVEY